MRQQAKPLIIKHKPSRKTKPNAQKASICNGLDADIARGLNDQQVKDHAGAATGDDRLRASSATLQPSPAPHGVNLDVEATRAICQAEVGASRTMHE